MSIDGNMSRFAVAACLLSGWVRERKGHLRNQVEIGRVVQQRFEDSLFQTRVSCWLLDGPA